MAKAVVLEWAGKSYTLTEDQAFEAGEALEEVITLSQLTAMGANIKFFKLARAYSAMLAVIGVQAPPGAVHSAMMTQIKDLAGKAGATEDQAGRLFASHAVQQLVEILMDGAPSDGDADDAGKATGVS